MQSTRLFPNASHTTQSSGAQSNAGVSRRPPLASSQNTSPSRPSFSPRASSLGIPTRLSSSTNVNAHEPTARSNLKQELRPSSALTDTMDALTRLMGPTFDHESLVSKSQCSMATRPRSLETEITFGTLSLREYVNTAESNLDNVSRIPEVQRNKVGKCE